MIVNSNMEGYYTDNYSESVIIAQREKENFLREFYELDISRSNTWT